MPEDRSYQLIILGEIAEGVDYQEVKEKLAIIFEKDEKQIDKLFKKPKPTILRKNLTEDIVLRYKIGLERIGVLCEIQGGKPSTQTIPNQHQTPPQESPTTLSFVDMEGTSLARGEGTVRITNFRIPLGALAVFLIKWFLASIPAFFLLGILITLIMQVLGGILGE